MKLFSKISFISIILYTTNCGLVFGQSGLMEKYQMLFKNECHYDEHPDIDTINLYSFANAHALDARILEIFQFPDYHPYSYSICRNVSVTYKDANLNIIVYLENSGRKFSDIPRVTRDNHELTFLVHSNDSIKYGSSLFGNSDSISSWVYEYFTGNAEWFKYYSPSFSKLVIQFGENYNPRDLEIIFQSAISGYFKFLENFSIRYFNIPFVAQDERHISAFGRSMPLNIVLDLERFEKKPLPKPSDTISDEDFEVFEVFEHSLLPKRNDTITLPNESYHTLSRAPYRDTLTANFHTGLGPVPNHIWKVGDTIKVKRWDSIKVINPDTLDNYLSRKYLPHQYYTGGLFHDGRVIVFFYRTDDFLLRNDTLFSWQQKTTLPADSTFKLALRHRIVDDGTYDFVSEYLQILNDNSYWEFDVLFYKGIGCNRPESRQPYFTHQIVMEDYWETDFGVFFQFYHYSNTNLSVGSNSFRTPYIINDRFEFYQIGNQNKRIEAIKLEFLESGFEKYQLKYCQ